MPIIEIDEQTFLYLQSKAIAFVEQPGDTIKRLLQINQEAQIISKEPIPYQQLVKKGKDQNELNDSRSYYSKGQSRYSSSLKAAKKKRKTNLPELVEAGILHENQALTFQNYRGVKFPKYKVIISDGLLKWNDTLYSMSDLARTILKDLDENHSNDAVRGPIFWITQQGETIAELWDQYLATKGV